MAASSPKRPACNVLGLPFLRRRKSSLMDEAGDDARDLSAHLAAHLGAGSASVTAAIGKAGRPA
jgi:putative flavoprotein involved in K+ transport